MGQLHFECLPLMPSLCLCYLSARTKEVKTLSSFSSRASGLSYSRMMPRFITITRSAFKMVWTRCCAVERERIVFHSACGTDLSDRHIQNYTSNSIHVTKRSLCYSKYQGFTPQVLLKLMTRYFFNAL